MQPSQDKLETEEQRSGLLIRRTMVYRFWCDVAFL